MWAAPPFQRSVEARRPALRVAPDLSLRRNDGDVMTQGSQV
jgi:hypothetical protein